MDLVFQDELNVRPQRLIDKRTKAAGFRDHKTLEDLDWTFNPALQRHQMYELACGQFIRQRRAILLVGPPGLGKSPLAQASGYPIIKAGFQVFYCSSFDLVHQLQAEQSPAPLDRTWARYLKPDLLVIEDRGLKRPSEEWGKLLNDVPAATAILDRFLPHAQIIARKGRSYRLRHAGRSQEPEGEQNSGGAPSGPGKKK